MKAFIFVQPDFVDKTDRQILRIINGRHLDYMTLVYLMRGLVSFGYEVSLSSWNEIGNLDFDGTELLVVPQMGFISGRIKQFDVFLPFFQQAIKSGCSILLTHHHQYEFTDYFGLGNVYDRRSSYFASQIESLKLNSKEPTLIQGIEEFWQSPRKVRDEFTYLRSRSSEGFQPVIEKIPVSNRRRSHSPFLCLAYKKLPVQNFAFLIDIHGTGGKKTDNGALFRLILHNVLGFLSHRPHLPIDLEQKAIQKIQASPISETEKKALIDSRIGQGRFRQNLLSYWKGCAITRIRKSTLLRASHIKPWRVGTNKERLDTFNGLLLLPNLDLAFDLGYISFDNQGKIILSSQLTMDEQQKLGVSDKMIIVIEEGHRKYLKYHRTYILKK